MSNSLEFVFNENIWDIYDERKAFIVITTNIGWKADGCNVMGAGLAKQAASRFEWLAERYGIHCKAGRTKTSVVVYHDSRLIMLPTKPLDIGRPWASWMGDSSIQLIEKGLGNIKAGIKKGTFGRKKIVMTLPGAGCGNIETKKSLNLLKKYFSGSTQVIVCDFKL